MNSFVAFISAIAVPTTIVGVSELSIQRQRLKEPRAAGNVWKQNVLCPHSNKMCHQVLKNGSWQSKSDILFAARADIFLASHIHLLTTVSMRHLDVFAYQQQTRGNCHSKPKKILDTVTGSQQFQTFHIDFITSRFKWLQQIATTMDRSGVKSMPC